MLDTTYIRTHGPVKAIVSNRGLVTLLLASQQDPLDRQSLAALAPQREAASALADAPTADGITTVTLRGMLAEERSRYRATGSG